jgi:hypothetical protein
MKNSDSIATVREWLLRKRGTGVTCPCCDQFVKLYRRPFTRSMAYVLLLLARYYRKHSPKEWLHVPSFIAEQAASNPRRAAAVRGDWAKMVHWGLIEKKPSGRPYLGYYRLTEKGRQFAQRTLKIPSHVYIYNKVKLPFPSSQLISINDALKHAFSYAEIMR